MLNSSRFPSNHFLRSPAVCPQSKPCLHLRGWAWRGVASPLLASEESLLRCVGDTEAAQSGGRNHRLPGLSRPQQGRSRFSRKEVSPPRRCCTLVFCSVRGRRLHTLPLEQVSSPAMGLWSVRITGCSRNLIDTSSYDSFHRLCQNEN